MMRGYVASAAVWVAMLIGTVVAAFFHLGYGLFDLETATVSAALLILALVVAAIFPFGTKRCAVLVAIMFLVYLDIYFPALLPGWRWFVIAAAALLALSIVASTPVTLVSAIAVIAGCVGAFISGPRALAVQVDKPSPNLSAPTVIHLIMDEHASDWGLPDEILSKAARDVLWASYVARGFLVFDRSYALDTYTHQSLSRLFNPPGNGEDILRETKFDLGTWRIEQSKAFEAIDKQRSLRVVGTSYFDFGPALAKLKNVSSFETYDPTVPGRAMRQIGASYADRFRAAASAIWLWIDRTQQSPGMRWVVSRIPLLQGLYGVRGRVTSIASMVVAREFVGKIERAGRGEYHLAHFLLPHTPYSFSAECHLQFVAPFHNEVVSGTDVVAARRARYELYFEQLKCTQKTVFAILDAVDRNGNLSDATVLIHGDHGSRINVKQLADWLSVGRSRDEYERDQRGAFMALRVPGLAAGRFQRPSEITEVYKLLSLSNFGELDLSKLKNADPTLNPQ